MAPELLLPLLPSKLVLMFACGQQPCEAGILRTGSNKTRPVQTCLLSHHSGLPLLRQLVKSKLHYTSKYTGYTLVCWKPQD